MQIETSLSKIAAHCELHTKENDAFKDFLKIQDPVLMDRTVSALNTVIEPQIDCTACGNCCRTLMINVEDAAIIRLANKLEITQDEFSSRFIENGASMQFFNAIPCHFLKDSRCTVYEERPSACREFPSLDQPGFTGRLFATFMHYSRCLIVFNVLESLKIATRFTRN